MNIVKNHFPKTKIENQEISDKDLVNSKFWDNVEQFVNTKELEFILNPDNIDEKAVFIINQIIEDWIIEYKQKINGKLKKLDYQKDISELHKEMLYKAMWIIESFNFLNNHNSSIISYNEVFVLEALNDLLSCYKKEIFSILKKNQ